MPFFANVSASENAMRFKVFVAFFAMILLLPCVVFGVVAMRTARHSTPALSPHSPIRLSIAGTRNRLQDSVYTRITRRAGPRHALATSRLPLLPAMQRTYYQLHIVYQMRAPSAFVFGLLIYA